MWQWSFLKHLLWVNKTLSWCGVGTWINSSPTIFFNLSNIVIIVRHSSGHDVHRWEKFCQCFGRHACMSAILKSLLRFCPIFTKFEKLLWSFIMNLLMFALFSSNVNFSYSAHSGMNISTLLCSYVFFEFSHNSFWFWILEWEQRICWVRVLTRLI